MPEQRLQPPHNLDLRVCGVPVGRGADRTTHDTFDHFAQAEAIAKAKAEGKYRGRGRAVDYAKVKRLHQQGVSPTEVANLLWAGRTTIYRALAA